MKIGQVNTYFYWKNIFKVTKNVSLHRLTIYGWTLWVLSDPDTKRKSAKLPYSLKWGVGLMKVHLLNYQALVLIFPITIFYIHFTFPFSFQKHTFSVCVLGDEHHTTTIQPLYFSDLDQKYFIVGWYESSGNHLNNVWVIWFASKSTLFKFFK